MSQQYKVPISCKVILANLKQTRELENGFKYLFIVYILCPFYKCSTEFFLKTYDICFTQNRMARY